MLVVYALSFDACAHCDCVPWLCTPPACRAAHMLTNVNVACYDSTDVLVPP